MKLKSLLDRTINWIYPYRCPICSKLILDSNYLCKNCQKEIYLNQPPYCKLCGIHIPESENLCKDCKLLIKKQTVWYDRVISPFLYKASLKRIIHIIKYNKKLPLARYAGKLLAKSLIDNELVRDIDYIIPIPLHPAKLKERGFNQSKIFSCIISESMGIKLLSNVLYRKKFTVPQSGLSKQERFKNVNQAFSIIDKNIRHTNILLIDDIFTTGATVNECSKVLKQNGVSYITVATLAR